jgi:4,5-DOPA dioxygenase extradiol
MVHPPGLSSPGSSARDLQRLQVVYPGRARYWWCLLIGRAANCGPEPETVHDFGGFPRALYELKYPAPGAPMLSQSVKAILAGQGYTVKDDAEAGFDHGTWVPLLHMYPQADVPVFQLSMRVGDGPEDCFRIGRALNALREQGILIVGSGSLTHNLYEFRQGQDRPETYVEAFTFWVREALARGDVDSLLDYRRRAPHAERAHPTEEHLLPLFLALGAAGGNRVNVHCVEGGITHGVLAMDAFLLGHPVIGSSQSSQWQTRSTVT